MKSLVRLLLTLKTLSFKITVFNVKTENQIFDDVPETTRASLGPQVTKPQTIFTTITSVRESVDGREKEEAVKHLTSNGNNTRWASVVGL